MPAVVTGDPTTLTTPLTAAVVSLSNNGSGAVRVVTNAPHLFGPGDDVRMSGTGLAALDGVVFPITVIAASIFDLVGSTYSATATGTATDLSLTPQIQIPSDGDGFSAQLSGLISSQTGTLARTQRVWQRVRDVSYALVGAPQTFGAGTPGTGNASYFGTNWGTATTLVSGNASSLGTISVTPSIGDLIEASFASSLGVTDTTGSTVSYGTTSISLGYEYAGGGITYLPKASCGFIVNALPFSPIDHNTLWYPCACSDTFTATSSKAVQFFVNGYSTTLAGGFAASLYNAWSLQVKVWRPVP